MSCTWYSAYVTHSSQGSFVRSIYHKTQQVYTEKEIIALAAKAGVNANSIPDVHQSLVDDGLVEKEKIGGSNYCWAFKAKTDRLAQKEYQKTLALIQQLKPQVEEASAQLADAKRGREDDSDDRASKLRRLVELETRKTKLQAELEVLKENDPAALADLEKELKLVTEAAHRWTDNIFECKSYLIKKRGMEKTDAMKILGITANFDCKEEIFLLYTLWLIHSLLTEFLQLATCFSFVFHALFVLFQYFFLVLDPEDK